MLEIYTIYGGGMWKTALDAVVTLIGMNTFSTLMRMAGTFAVLAVLLTFIKQRNPMVFVQWLAIFMLINTILLVPKRSVQVIDISDPAAVWKTDNVPVGLAAIASLTTSVGFKIASVYDTLMARPDSITYSKTGMLFGSQIVAETSDFTTQNPELSQMLPDYVENCVIGDILLNHKYTVNELLNSSDPLGLITSNPSPLRGIFKTTSATREFLTCRDAATQIRALANTEANTASATFSMLARKIFGTKVNGATLLANAMGESYGYFYAGGMSAAQIMKNNITNSAVRQGIKGFAARSSDTANLLNLASENAATKQRLSWAAGNVLATRTLPFAQSLLMLILVCLFPLMIALAAANHSLFGLNTLKLYVGGFIYFQMWPVMFAILNYASNYWLQSKTGGTALVLANTDVVALQHSDVANLAGYLAMSIPILSFYLTKGASAIGSQVAGSVLSSAAFGSAGVASTATDGNWSFNNMSMDNLSQNKMDTNLMQRQGQQTWQADNGSTQTMTAGGHTVIDGSGAMSNLPVNMKLSQLASSGFQESARQSDVQAKTALDGYNHSVTSGWSQLSQLSRQSGTSDSLIRGSENSQTTNATRGASMMMSAAENYAKANNISTQEAYNQLMSKSLEGSVNAGASGKFNTGDQALGKIGKWATGVSAEAHVGAELKGASGSSHGTQETHSDTQEMRHDKNSQAVNDFRQGMDMVTSSRVTDGSNHTENAATSNVQQFASTLNDAQSQYQQYTTSSTQSNEFSRMATLAQNQSASLDTNYTQEFVDWASDKYGDRAQGMLTSAPSAREAAMEFVNERLKPEIMGDYQQGRSDLSSGNEHAAFSGDHVVRPSPVNDSSSGSNSQGHYPVSTGMYQSGSQPAGRTRGGENSPEYPVTGQQAPSGRYAEMSADQSGSDGRNGINQYQTTTNGGNGGIMQSGSRTSSATLQSPVEHQLVGGSGNENRPGTSEWNVHQSSSSELTGMQSGRSSSGNLNVGDGLKGMVSNPTQTASLSSANNQDQTERHDGHQPVGASSLQSEWANAGTNGQQPLSSGHTELQSGQKSSSGMNTVNATQDHSHGPSGSGMLSSSRNTSDGQIHHDGQQPLSSGHTELQSGQRSSSGMNTVNTMQDPSHGPSGSGMLSSSRNTSDGQSHHDGQQPLSSGHTELQSGQRSSSGMNTVNATQDPSHGPSGSDMLSSSRNTSDGQSHHDGQQPLSSGHTELQSGQRTSSGLNTVSAAQEPSYGPSGRGIQNSSRNAFDNQVHNADLHNAQQTPVNPQGLENGRNTAVMNGREAAPDGLSEAPSSKRVPESGNYAHQPDGAGNARSDNRDQNVGREMSGSQQILPDRHNGKQRQGAESGQHAGTEDTLTQMTEGVKKSAAINQAKLSEWSGSSFEPQNELQRRVAEQRSANEQNINESAGEIGKKQSTVQTSSDIFKGEMENIKSQFQEGKKLEELKQKAMPFLERDEIEMHKQNLEDLRKRVG